VGSATPATCSAFRRPPATSAALKWSAGVPLPAEFDRLHGLMMVEGDLQANPAIERPFTKT
jgi:hypothetical protein